MSRLVKICIAFKTFWQKQHWLFLDIQHLSQMQHIWKSNVPVMTHEAVQGLQIRYASFSNILTNMKNYLSIMNQGLQIRYALLQVQLLLQYNTDSKINKLAKLRRCVSRVHFGIHFGKHIVLNVLCPAIWINCFAFFGYISVSTIDLLGPGQHSIIFVKKVKHPCSAMDIYSKEV